MAEYRNITDDELWVPLVNRAVKPGETFEVDDDTARDLAFSDELFETVDAPPAPPTNTVPAKNASAEAWREYALAEGADPDRVAGMSRDDLIAEFGEKES